MMNGIGNCTDYKIFEQLQFQLEAQAGKRSTTFPNPSQADINQHILNISQMKEFFVNVTTTTRLKGNTFC
jgi:hypothetical protein